MNSHESCPICNSNSELLYSLRADFLHNKLECYYKETVPKNINNIDYELFRCDKCSLEYSIPMLPGTDQFYNWVTGHSGYYLNSRWEWQVALGAIITQKNADVNCLEIGCGTGTFLELAKKNDSVKMVGIDLTKTSVDVAQRKGLEVYCETVEEYSANSQHAIKSFDYILAFHTLEHVPEPKVFIASLLVLLKPDGSIYLSTPYSPMSFEYSWFDPLNHPPHHLTRWNEKSYRKLAQQLKLDIKLIMPSPLNLIKRIFFSLTFQFNGNSKTPFRKVLLQSIKKPMKLMKTIKHQIARDKIDNETTADVVLVELKRK